MTLPRSSLGKPSTDEAQRRWNDERSLRRTIRIARIGYWESCSATAAQFWVSPDFASSHNLQTTNGSISITGMLDPDGGQSLREFHLACWSQGRPFTVHTRLQILGGGLLDCVVHGEPEFGSSGYVKRVFGIVRDVTAETSTERLLAESEQRFADFVSTASDWCWESDADHRLLPYPQSLDGNAALQSVASGGKTRWELTYAPEEQDAMTRHRADMEAHRPFRDFIYTSIGGDGSRISIRTSGKPIFSDSGTFV